MRYTYSLPSLRSFDGKGLLGIHLARCSKTTSTFITWRLTADTTPFR